MKFQDVLKFGILDKKTSLLPTWSLERVKIGEIVGAWPLVSGFLV